MEATCYKIANTRYLDKHKKRNKDTYITVPLVRV